MSKFATPRICARPSARRSPNDAAEPTRRSTPSRRRRRTSRRLRRDLIAFGAAFGLTAIEDHRSAEADGVVRIEVVRDGGRLGYIPYTDRAISWHTDGYYNYHGPDRFVGAMLLHCARDADQGGRTACSIRKSPISGCATSTPATSKRSCIPRR